MFVLIACEESQRVCMAFRAKGHSCFSCDIQECSGGRPEWHIMGDVMNVINKNNGVYVFSTMDGTTHYINKWDLIIAHPPCTFLTVAGNRWFNISRYGDKAVERMVNREKAIEFVKAIWAADCDKVVIENPVGVLSTVWQKPTQIIQPYYFGDHARKTTCLWLRGVKPLTPTNIVDMGEIRSGGYSVGASAFCAYDENGKCIPWNDERTAKERSKTFPGIAHAMAEQWG